MAGPALQLFPPPPRAPRQTSPSRRPIPNVKSATPNPTSDRREVGKATKLPADFHELVIQVNSVPISSPSRVVPPALAIVVPPQAHISSSHLASTPPQLGAPVFASPLRQGTPAPVVPVQEELSRPQNARAPSPSTLVRDVESRLEARIASPEINRAPSPAFSTCETLVRANSTATQVRSILPQDVRPMRSMFPVYDPSVPLTNQSYRPSEASPTNILRTQISRSPYSPEPYIPHSHVRSTTLSATPATPKLFFTPSALLDNLWLAANGQEEPSVQLYTMKMHRATKANPAITFGTTPSLPFYSLSQSNFAGGNDVQSIMNELLIQRHHPTQPRILPVAHLDLIPPPSLDTVRFDPQQQETTTLLTTIFPKLAALQALDAAANSPAASRLALTDPAAQSPAAQRLAEDVLAGVAERECCTLAWTKDDPSQQANPWAKHIPCEGSYHLEHPTLGHFPIKLEGDCSVINTPSTRPVTAIYGHNMPMKPQIPQGKPASISILSPFVFSPATTHTTSFSPLSPPPSLREGMNRPISLTPSEMSISALPTAVDATADDSVLARIDFIHDSLTLNLGAITQFNNPFLPDVITSALLAVAVAEATRGRKTRNNSQDSFEPPPPSLLLTQEKDDTARAFKDSFVDGFNSFGGKSKTPINASSLKRFASSLRSGTTAHSESTSAGHDKDIELGEWYGQSQTKNQKSKAEQKARKKADKEDQLPLLARGIIGIIKFAFMSVVWVLKVLVKLVMGLVVMITRNLGRL